MDNRTAQLVWADAGFYTGAGFDGIIGPRSREAVNRIEARMASSYTFLPVPADEYPERRIIAATQAALASLGHSPGPVDGYIGDLTREAIAQWLYARENGGARQSVPRIPARAYMGSVAASALPLQRDVPTVYGQAGTPQLEQNLTTLEFPFAFRIDWNLQQTTNRIRVHRRVSDNLYSALIGVHDHYGEDRWRALGLDRYAGAYNPRKMRGSDRWSMHAYGIAIDFFAEPNGLRTRCPDALFCRAEYVPFLDIMESHGWLPALRLWGADAMHFQAARL